MTQQELKNIPEGFPLSESIGVCFIAPGDPITVTDKDGEKWCFGLRLKDNKKVRVKR